MLALTALGGRETATPSTVTATSARSDMSPTTPSGPSGSGTQPANMKHNGEHLRVVHVQ